MVDQAKVQEKLGNGAELSEEEQRFLQDRDQLPEGYDPVPVTFQSIGGSVVSNDPIAVLQNANESRINDLDAEVERRVAEELARRVGSEIQHEQIVAATPHTGDANTAVHRTQIDAPVFSTDEDGDDDEDEGEEDYEDGWNNDARRAELAKRGLPTEGNKDELIARLVESDNSEE